MSAPSDNELSRWFADEVQPHEKSLRSYLRQSVHSLSDVDDLMQDTYSRIVQAKGRGPITATKPFLFAIARNAVRDFFRARQRFSPEPIAETASLAVLEEKAGLVDSICHEQERKLLHEAFNTLPERCREVMILRKVKGLPQREIARLLGISESTVEAQVVKGTQRVIEFFAAQGLP